MILASFFDPNSNGFDITDVGAILFFAIAAVGAVTGVAHWSARMVRRIVKEEVAHATQPIQPNYRNGGQSLADVSAKLDQIVEHLQL
jgi:hypothetical protein